MAKSGITIADIPRLNKEFHPELNGTTKARDVAKGSHKQVWWQCPVKSYHVYDMPPLSRTGKAKSNCPFCAGRRTHPKESIAVTHPELTKQWDEFSNLPQKPTEFSSGSSKKVWWICSKNQNHCWSARISDRALKNAGCPICAGKRVIYETSLAAIHPEIAKDWHPTLNGELTADKVAPRSSKTIWWTCPVSELHDYDAIVADRTDTQKHTGCPFCAGVRVAPDTSLEFKFPLVAQEWHPTKNGTLKPSEVTAGSGQKIWWVCERQHEFEMTPHERTFFNRGCNQCSKFGSSQETQIFCEIKYFYEDVKFRHKISNVEFDIFIPSLNIAIEYDGAFYHAPREESDLAKNKFAQENGMDLIRVREFSLPKIGEQDVITPQRVLTKNDLDLLFHSIFILRDHQKRIYETYISKHEFFNIDEYNTYMSYFPSPFPENSLAETHPEMAAQWDHTKNYPLTPYNFTYGSHYDAFWICNNNHSHQSRINTKSTNFDSSTQGCPFCSGRQTLKEKSLKHLNPKLAEDWHPTKNGSLTPKDVSLGSDMLVWWRCPEHPEIEWQATTRVRVRGYERCSICAPSRRNRIKKEEVAALLGQGKKKTEIARMLGTTVATINRRITELENG